MGFPKRGGPYQGQIPKQEEKDLLSKEQNKVAQPSQQPYFHGGVHDIIVEQVNAEGPGDSIPGGQED